MEESRAVRPLRMPLQTAGKVYQLPSEQAGADSQEGESQLKNKKAAVEQQRKTEKKKEEEEILESNRKDRTQAVAQ